MDAKTTPRLRKGSHGISWSNPETGDLLAIWGEQKVKEQLKVSYRNIDLFEKNAADMGMIRPTEECRMKMKLMRKNYHQVNDHNSKSGNDAAMIPFYKELHAILGSYANYHPKRLGSTTDIVCVLRGSVTPHHAPLLDEEVELPPPFQEIMQGYSEELFSSPPEETGTQDSDEAAVTLTLTKVPGENLALTDAEENTSDVVTGIDTIWATTPARSVATLSNPTAKLYLLWRDWPCLEKKQHSAEAVELMVNSRSIAELFVSNMSKSSDRQDQRAIALQGYLEKFYEHEIETSQEMLKEIKRQNDLFADLVIHIKSLDNIKKRVVVKRVAKPNVFGEADKENSQESQQRVPSTSSGAVNVGLSRQTRIVKKCVPLTL